MITEKQQNDDYMTSYIKKGHDKKKKILNVSMIVLNNFYCDKQVRVPKKGIKATNY